MSDVVEALNSLVPNAKFTLVGSNYENVIWNDDRVKPSEEEVNAEIIKLEQDYIAKQYQRDRELEYPSIGDQLDALFHAGVFPADMAAKIQAVKDKYPKSE